MENVVNSLIGISIQNKQRFSLFVIPFDWWVNNTIFHHFVFSQFQIYANNAAHLQNDGRRWWERDLHWKYRSLLNCNISHSKVNENCIGMRKMEWKILSFITWRSRENIPCIFISKYLILITKRCQKQSTTQHQYDRTVFVCNVLLFWFLPNAKSVVHEREKKKNIFRALKCT